MSSSRIDIRNAILCALAAIIACVLVWPIADMPFNDDWSYSFTVKRLGETGHILYNGWSSPSIIFQAYWGWLWVKLFGFSFNVLRCSTIPLAGGSVAITYLLARRAGLFISASIFSALLLGFSPLFLPLATSFMTDVPGCFCFLLSVYALIRAGESASIRWMMIGVVIAAIGGSSRQIVWVASFALLPYVAFINRKNSTFVLLTTVCWISTIVVAVAIQHWFELQPYAIPEQSLRSEWTRAIQAPDVMLSRFWTILITLVLITLPTGVAILARLRTSRPLAAISGLVVLIMARVMFAERHFPVGPWMINILTTKGVLGGALISGDRPDMLPWPIFAIISVVVFTLIAVLIATRVLRLIHLPVTLQRLRNILLQPTPNQIALSSMVLICIGYLTLLLTRCVTDFALFDRHLIMLIPFAGILLLRLGRNISVAQWTLLGLFGLYAIGSTQENLAAARARGTAVQILRDAGVPRSQMSGGFDFDAWTQLERTGYVNDARIKIPANAFHPGQGRTPDVRPIYRIEYGPMRDTQETRFGSVPYFSLWPPFERRVCIDKIFSPN